MDTEILTAFMELNRKIDSNFDKMDKKMDDLCNRTTLNEAAIKAIDYKIDTHLDNQEKKSIRKEKVFYVIMAIMGFSFGVFQYISSLS